MRDHEGTLQIENDDFSLKTKIILTHINGSFEVLKFDEKRFSKTFLSFSPYWDYKPTITFRADSPREYTRAQIIHLSP